MTYEQAQARKAHFDHLDNVQLVALFLKSPSGSPYRWEDGDVLCEMIADREALGQNPADDFEASFAKAR
jgi:hypothetical protein